VSTGHQVAVVIPCLNEEATLGRCVASVRRQVPAPDLVVVVDDGSSDSSREIARQVADLVVERHGLTVAATRNAGVAAAGGHDVVAFIDADCEAAPGWIAAGLGGLEDADLVGARVHAPPDATWVARRWSAIELRMGRPGAPLWSANLLVRRAAFSAVGGFAEQLATGEDVDLCRRMQETGYRVAPVPAMRVVHHGFPSTLAGFVRRERWHASTAGWWWALSHRSKLLVAVAAMWGLAGIGSGVRSAARRSAAPVRRWGLLSGAGVVGAGAVSGARRHAVSDGILLATWALVRVSRLATGVRPPVSGDEAR
jgi:glycosyltransferase involved in cell wall biosynthesis